MKTQNNKPFIIVTETILILFIMGGLGAAISGRLFTVTGLISIGLLYGVIKKTSWIIGALRVFGAYLMYYTTMQIKGLFVGTMDPITIGIAVFQGLLFIYGLICLLFTPKFVYIEKVSDSDQNIKTDVAP